MMGKTHVAVGIATAFLVLQPKTVPELITTTIGGSIGGVMADIDVKIDNSNKYAKKASMDALYGELLAAGLSISLLLADFFNKGSILQTIAKYPVSVIIGALLFIALSIIGKKSEHRDRTHSLVALILFTFSVILINGTIATAFAIGYGSHLLIDLFNKRPIRLLYPLKKGFCFQLSYADRLCNEILLIIGVAVIGFYLANMPIA